MKYKNNILLVLMLSSFSFIKVNAQETKALTLNEAIDLGIKNSKQLKLSQARIDEAVAATKQATEARLPDASISASYLRLTKPTVNMKSTKTDSTGVPGFSAPSINQALYGSRLPVVHILQ